jgi:hypothetical protein
VRVISRSDLIPADLQFFVEAELAAGRYRTNRRSWKPGSAF